MEDYYNNLDTAVSESKLNIITSEYKPPTLKVKLLTNNAIAPRRKTTGAIGYDLCSTKTMVLQPLHTYTQKHRFDVISKVPTGVAVEIPPGMYGRVAPRSGLSTKGLTVRAGVIDNDYRGEIMVLLTNTGEKPVSIVEGDAIAQLILEVAQTPEVEVVNELSNTQRNTGGFGSTGR